MSAFQIIAHIILVAFSNISFTIHGRFKPDSHLFLHQKGYSQMTRKGTPLKTSVFPMIHFAITTPAI